MEGTRLQILIVEDEEAHVEAIRRALERSGLAADVRVAGTLRGFREALAGWSPDIVLLDMNLPDGRAVEVLTAPPEAGPFPTLIMTSYGNEQVAVEAIKAGALDYVVKSAEAFADMPRSVERVLREWTTLQARKRAEEALRESEERFRALFEQAPLAYQSLDREARILDMNQAWLEMLGYAREEVVGHWFVDFLEPSCTARFKEDFALFVACGATRSEYEMIHRDGTIRYVSFQGRIGHDLKGEFKQTHCILQDTTENRRLEAQLRQAMKMEAMGRMAGGVAHDFNNMLGVILGYAEMALARLVPDDPLYRDILEIQKAGSRSAEMTRQLLAFSRKQVVAPKAIDLNKVIEGQRRMLGRLVGEDIEFRFAPAKDLWLLKVDPSQIDQILANLAVNARDAMKDTGTITIETANEVLEETICQDGVSVPAGDYVLLSFSDTGEGMDATVLGRIFEPFFTTKEPGHGTGLGLSTVYVIVRQAGGLVQVESKPGEGTTFRIHLPRFRGVAEESVEQPGDLPLARGETVLVVEDEAQMLSLVRDVLSGLAYRVLTTRSPEEACRLAEEHPGEIHLLVTDVIMPGMTGGVLAKRILEIRPGIRVTFISGYTGDSIVRRGLLEEGVSFLQKPFSARALADFVRQALDRPAAPSKPPEPIPGQEPGP